jgi:hypothetical protein
MGGNTVGATFAPLAAGVLMVAGGFESGTGNESGEGIEEEQVGLELSDFVGDGGALAALAFDERAAGLVDRRGRVGFGPDAEVFTDDVPVDAPGAGVVTSAMASFPGHERRRGWWREKSGAVEGALHKGAGEQVKSGANPRGATHRRVATCLPADNYSNIHYSIGKDKRGFGGLAANQGMLRIATCRAATAYSGL